MRIAENQEMMRDKRKIGSVKGPSSESQNPNSSKKWTENTKQECESATYQKREETENPNSESNHGLRKTADYFCEELVCLCER